MASSLTNTRATTLLGCTCRRNFSASLSPRATPLRSFLGLESTSIPPAVPSSSSSSTTSDSGSSNVVPALKSSSDETPSSKRPSSFPGLARLFGRSGNGKGRDDLDGSGGGGAAHESRRHRRDIETERALEKAFRTKTGAMVGGGGSAGAGVVQMRCTTLNDKGNVTVTSGSLSKSELCTRYGIQPRDLRKLDSGVPTVIPTILVRRHAILFTVLHLRVVITANEVTLFDSIRSEDSWLKGVFVWHLEHALKATNSSLPYEFRALESCLLSVTTALETEMTNIRDMVGGLLDQLEEHIDRDRLRLLLQYRRKLSAFQKRATLVQQCLEEVLQNDDDLVAMYLSSGPRQAHEHEEIELLLESFSKQCEEIVSEVEGLSANVRHTEDIIELILDSNRNSLLGMDLKVSICTVGLTSGALVAGLFGCVLFSTSSAKTRSDRGTSTTYVRMNLSTQLESHPYAFGIVTSCAFAFAGLVTVFGLRRLRKLRKVQLGGGGGGSDIAVREHRDGVLDRIKGWNGAGRDSGAGTSGAGRRRKW